MSAREEIAGLIVKNIELQERIEALEAALRTITRECPPTQGFVRIKRLADEALAPEQDDG